VADKKFSQLAKISQPEGGDLLPIVDDPNGTPLNKVVTVKTLFGRLKANTMFVGSNNYFTANTTCTNRMVANTFIVASDKIRITTTKTPSSNNTTTESLAVGHMFFDANYLYICTGTTTIKRVALSLF
jgi:hypothetical protein